MSGSKLTEHQLRAAIERGEATEQRHRAAGRHSQANAAAIRAAKNRAELEERKTPPRPQLEPAPAQLPELPTAAEAIARARALVAVHGAAEAIHALQIAIADAPPMDVADGVRILQMRRKVQA